MPTTTKSSKFPYIVLLQIVLHFPNVPKTSKSLSNKTQYLVKYVDALKSRNRANASHGVKEYRRAILPHWYGDI